MKHIISKEHLSLGEVKAILDNRRKVELSPEAVAAIEKCRGYLDTKMKDPEKPLYGITTGFGSLCNVTILADELSQLQHNLVMSHACGAGETVRPDIVRLMLLLKAQSLSYGHSGVQVVTVQRSWTCSAMTFFRSSISRARSALPEISPPRPQAFPSSGWEKYCTRGKSVRRGSLEGIRLGADHAQSKEGLALLNGTQFMSAHAVWSLLQCHRLSEWADKIGALSLEAYDGRIEPFLPLTHQLRPHRGQIETGERFCRLLEGSGLIHMNKEHIQDPYSFRCIPQVHGAVKDNIYYVESVIENEINSATDNPNIFPEEDMIISAGNFHGEPIAIPMDALAIAMSELANISERRIYRLISGQRELPRFLVANPGLNSGFMIPQYTAASIVSQNKGLCWPASVDSIPSSQGQEDHVSMGANAATKLVRVVDNCEKVLAIELLNAAQALDFRHELSGRRSSDVLEEIFSDFRKVVPFIRDDVYMHPLIEASITFIR